MFPKSENNNLQAKLPKVIVCDFDDVSIGRQSYATHSCNDC